MVYETHVSSVQPGELVGFESKTIRDGKWHWEIVWQTIEDVQPCGDWFAIKVHGKWSRSHATSGVFVRA